MTDFVVKPMVTDTEKERSERATANRFARASRRRAALKHVATYTLLVVFCLLALAPIVWGLLTSFKAQSSVVAYPPKWIPAPFTLENYIALFGRGTIPKFFLNSLILSLGTIGVSLVIAVPAAYAAARFRFYGKNPLMLLILATSMIPGVSILIPIYLFAIQLDVLNNYAFMILVYSAWMVPQAIWFMKNFIEVVPLELEEAALIDGCSRIGAFLRVVLPLIKPGIAAVSMLLFMFVWNDFLIGAILATDESMRTVQVGLVRFIQDTIGVWWGQFMAFAMLAIAPVIVAFLFLQKQFVEGLTAGGVKG